MLEKSIVEIKEYMEKALHIRGIEEKYISFIVQDYLNSQLEEKFTHGISKMLLIDEQLKQRKGAPVIENKNGNYALINGNKELGHIAAIYGINELEELMKSGNGIAMVGVYNCSRYSRLKEFGKRIAEKGYIGLIMNNGGPAAVVPYNGIEPILGTNPICFSFPKEKEPLVIDFSTAKEVWGEIRQAIVEKREIQTDAFLDEEGNITHSPEKVNSVLPLGNDPKGYALCLAIEILTGVLANAKIGKQVNDQYDLGYLFIAIDPKVFGQLNNFENKVLTICKEIKNSQNKENEIYLPGEQSSRTRQKAIEMGIVKIDQETYERLKTMSNSLDGGLTYISDLID